MDKRIYEKTKYPGIWRNIKNKNYIVDICSQNIRSSISTVDGTKSGAKILDIKVARRIQQDPSIIKRVSLSINNKDTVSKAWETYLYDAINNRNLKENTISGKKSTFKLYCKEIKDKRLVTVTKDDILQIKIKIDNNCEKDSSKYAALKTVKSFFNWLVDQKIISESPAKEIKQFPKTKIIHTIWSPSQVNIFRKTVENDFNNENTIVAYKARMIHLLVNLDYCMSARIGETRGLQFKKINYEAQTVTISAIANNSGHILEQTKTDVSKDTLDVPEQIINEIKEYSEWISKNLDIDITGETPLFPCPENTTKTYTATVIHDTYKKYCDLCEPKIPEMPIYNLRHSGVALMQELNYETYVIQNRVRHKNIETTIDTYGSISKNTKKKLVNDISKFF